MLACVAIGTTAAPERPWPVDYEADKGFYVGKGFVLRPHAEGLVGYDDRVVYSDQGKEGDFYSDVAAAAELLNMPSVYDLRLYGRYGYRFYGTYNELNDDFYTAAGSIGTDKEPFVWDLTADLTKSAPGDSGYNTGSTPDPVLTSLSNTRFLAGAKAEYDKKWFGKTSLVPIYDFSYFYQIYDRDNIQDTEWTIHRGALLLRRQHTKKTRFATGAAYTFQSRDIEDGRIGTLLVGMDHQMTDKTSWQVQLGYAIANYELSGEDQGVVSNLRGNWAYSSKLSFYVFGGNNFQPGYGGGAARWVYRLGYGGQWNYAPKLFLNAAMLHDYQQAIGDRGTGTSIYGGVRNYIDLKAGYTPTDPLELVAGIRYNDDERPEPQTKVYLQAVYRFY